MDLRPLPITLTELRYLVNLDLERHFGRAADRSFVSQPTLSVALKKVEDMLGVTLFERNRNDIKPTLVGERVVAQAKRTLIEARRIDEIAREGKDEKIGPLRLGTIYTVAPYLLPSLAPKLYQLAPQMPLIIEENFTSKLLEQLRDNELDIAIIALPYALEGFQIQPLYEEEFMVLLPPQHRWLEKTHLHPRELGEENLLLLGSGHCFREQVVQACPQCIAEDTAAPRTGSSLETIRYMVASGLGVSVAPRSAVEGWRGPAQPAIPFEAPAPKRQVALVWRKSYPRLEAVRLLREAVSQCQIQGVSWLD
jgi:LysR family hydrogen peroxide-inducible transcriptional activator